LKFNYLCNEFISNLKNLLSNIRTYQCKIFTLMLLIYSITVLSSFYLIKGYNLSNDGLEFSSVSDNINFSSELYDLVELLKSEEEETDNNKTSFGDFYVAKKEREFVLSLQLFDIQLSKQKQSFHLNTPPKYLLYHQLKIYSLS
jgi:hypothetical protein